MDKESIVLTFIFENKREMLHQSNYLYLRRSIYDGDVVSILETPSDNCYRNTDQQNACYTSVLKYKFCNSDSKLVSTKFLLTLMLSLLAALANGDSLTG